MIITLPNNNHLERKYIIEIFFHEFLGIKYTVEFSEVDEWIIEFNDKKIRIKDGFFNNFPRDLTYLKEENLPKEIKKSKNEFSTEKDTLIIYGNDELRVNKNEIYCEIDVFASSFFMLTRWEEFVNKSRDRLNRFSAKESIAFKNNFLDRPVVNEYVEMLWGFLIYLGYEKKRKEKKYEFLVTHDVDFILLSQTPLKVIIKTFLGDVLKRRNPKLAVNFLLKYVKSFFSEKEDPYNSFDYLMDLSEKNKVKSYFFFMGTGTTIYDNNYKLTHPFLKEIIKKIKKRNHYIGIHPTFNAYNNGEQFTNEVKELKENLKENITFGREHYLRFEVPTTWQIWEDNQMEWDSTLGYHDKEGFRCGVCYSFSVFNILTRQKLKLKEKPLIVMEGTFAQYQKEMSIKDVEIKIANLVKKIKFYKGDFVFLWHNSSFNNREWNKYQILYERVLNKKI